VPRLPHGRKGLRWYTPKFGDHRAALLRSAESVRLQARSGRDVTAAWMDLALVGMMLRPGTVLDGEITIWHDGRIDFAAVQARAASGIDRSRMLAARLLRGVGRGRPTAPTPCSPTTLYGADQRS